MTTETNRSGLCALIGIAAALAAAMTINTMTRSPAEASAADRTIALAISHGVGLRLQLRGTIPAAQIGKTTLICARIITTSFARVGIGCRRIAANTASKRFEIF